MVANPEMTDQLNRNQYRCEACGGIFDKGWSDAEVSAELREQFPGFDKDDCGLVCDACYRQMGFGSND